MRQTSHETLQKIIIIWKLKNIKHKANQNWVRLNRTGKN